MPPRQPSRARRSAGRPSATSRRHRPRRRPSRRRGRRRRPAARGTIASPTSPIAVQEVRRQRLAGLLDGLAQVVERDLARAPRQRHVQRATHGPPVPPACRSSFRLPSTGPSRPADAASRAARRPARATTRCSDRVRVARQPPVGGLLQLRDRIVHRGRPACAMASRTSREGSSLQLISSSGRTVRAGSALSASSAAARSAPGRAGIERQRGQPVEDAGALRQRRAGRAARAIAARRTAASVGAQRLEDRLDGARVGNGLERQQQRRPAAAATGGGRGARESAAPRACR